MSQTKLPKGQSRKARGPCTKNGTHSNRSVPTGQCPPVQGGTSSPPLRKTPRRETLFHLPPLFYPVQLHNAPDGRLPLLAGGHGDFFIHVDQTPYPSPHRKRQGSLTSLILLSPYKRFAFAQGPHFPCSESRWADGSTQREIYEVGFAAHPGRHKQLAWITPKDV